MYFFKNALKNESGQVPKQTCSQSAVRVVSIYDVEERAQCTGRTLAEPSDRKIEMADKKTRGKRLQNKNLTPCLHRKQPLSCCAS